MRLVKIKSIDLDKSIFIRDDLDEDAVQRYAEIYQSKGLNSLPPLLVQTKTMKLVDGFHRLEALKRVGKKKVLVKEKDISDIDLRAEATRLNIAHGIPIDQKERNEVIKRLYLEDNKTQSEIAEIVELDQSWVSRILEKCVTHKTNILVVKEWLLTELTQARIAKNYNISQPRVSQIISDFRDSVEGKFLSGWLKEEIRGWIKKGYSISKDDGYVEKALSATKLPKSLIGNDKIICGDFFKEIPLFEDRLFDLIYVDPPNSMDEEWGSFSEEGYVEFTKSWFTTILPKLKDDGRIFVSFSQERMFEFYEIIREIAPKFDLEFANLVVWNYRNNIKPHNKRQLKYTWGPVFFYRKKKAGKLNLPYGETWGAEGNGVTDTDCWTITIPQPQYNDNKKFHPTQKPLELLKNIVMLGTTENATVLDPFARSGTTAVACRELNRNFVVIEKNPEYVEIIKRRILKS